MSRRVSEDLRLLLVASEFPPGPGGIGTHAHHVALGLAHCGWQVDLLAPQDYTTTGDAERFVHDQPYGFTRLERRGGWAGRLVSWRCAITAALDHARPRAVVLSGMGPTPLAWREARRRRIPVVVVGHGKEFTQGGGLRKVLFGKMCRSADLLVCVSEFTAQIATDSGLAPGRVRVIANGADDEVFRPVQIPGGWREGRGLGNGPLLLTTGRLCERKGQDLVLRAMAAIAGRHPDLQYAAVGLPAEAARLRVLARDLGIDARFHTPGPVPREDLPFWYSAADIFVLTSRHSADGDVEGYGIVVIEAALCGTPAVVSDHGGLPEAVENGATGWVVPEGDAGKLADCIAGLLDDRARIATAGAAALERARTSCTWDRRVARYDEVLRAAAGLHRA